MFTFPEKLPKKHTATDVEQIKQNQDIEQIKKIQEEQIDHLNEQIEAKKDLKDLLEKNLQKAKESST